MFKITKRFEFCASHQLENLPLEHPCSRMHGHNYVVTFELSSNTLDHVGFVRDYRELDAVKKYIDSTFDHKHVNNVIFPLNPTAENMAKHLYDTFKSMYPELSAVEVSETPKTNARYEHTAN